MLKKIKFIEENIEKLLCNIFFNSYAICIISTSSFKVYI